MSVFLHIQKIIIVDLTFVSSLANKGVIFRPISDYYYLKWAQTYVHIKYTTHRYINAYIMYNRYWENLHDAMCS